MPLEPEFPCDRDLQPLVESGTMDEWQAMQVTAARNTARTMDAVAELQKKTVDILELFKMVIDREVKAPSPVKPKAVLRPKYRSG